MRIADGVYVLPIPRGSREADGFLNITLILDEENGNTLVDAGLPDQIEAISAALVEAGIGVGDLRASANRLRSAARSSLPAVATPSFSNESPYDDDHLGEGHPEVDDSIPTLGTP